MNKTWIVVVAVAGALFVPVATRAHEGHTHKVMGTVASVDGSHLMVKGANGQTVTVMIDAKTKITQGKTTLQAGALKVGDRVVAEGPEEKDMIMATTVKVGAAAAAPAARKK